MSLFIHAIIKDKPCLIKGATEIIIKNPIFWYPHNEVTKVEMKCVKSVCLPISLLWNNHGSWVTTSIILFMSGCYLVNTEQDIHYWSFVILHWSHDNLFIWKYFNTHHVWIMSRSTGTNQAMNLVLSVQFPISWGWLIDKCCVLCMGIVIFVLQLGLTFFFSF